MTTTSKYDPEVRERAVQMYLDGSKLRDITAATGIPRPTIMYYVQASGMEPNRQGTRRSRPRDEAERGDALAWIQTQYEAAIREIARLEAELENAHKRISQLERKI